MMKLNLKYLIYISLGLLVMLLTACPTPIDEEESGQFEDMKGTSIYGYLLENQENYSKFTKIVEAAGLKATLSAYNPNGAGYTLFLPNNGSIDQFVENSNRFASFDELISDQDYCKAIGEYHVLNMEIASSSFPFGAFPESTLSGDYLTVSFIIEEDSSYFKLNNYSVVDIVNIETSNGYIHQIEQVLEPVTFTSYQWLEENPEFSIFNQAVDLTGTRNLIDFNLKEVENTLAVTLLAEPDSIYHQFGIYSIEDLIDYVNPVDNQYTSEFNALYGYVAYHMLSGYYFVNDFVNVNTVYTTFSEVPVNINGFGLDVTINKGKQVFDTLVYESDTTYVDYIKFMYEESNVLTQSGVIHFIDKVMTQKAPLRTSSNFQFMEEPLLQDLRREAGTILIEENALLLISWSGADLFYVNTLNEEISAWNNDYLLISGDFAISYQLPKIIQGKYDVFIGADRYSPENALIEVFIDEKKIGNIIDLTTGGSAGYPFQRIKVGTIDFNRYSEHVIEIKPLIPGRFMWDRIEFVAI